MIAKGKGEEERV